MRTTYVIALQTIRGFIKDRLFHSSLVFSALFLLFCYFLSTLTIVESRKILLDFGLSAISLCGVMIALFLGSTVVGKEIEKRTIYTVLSKPVSRQGYLLGKLLGGCVVIAAAHVLNLLTLCLVLWMNGEGSPSGLVASVYLMILESSLIAAIALFFSLATSSLMLASALSIGVFLIGRSSQTLQAVLAKSEGVGAWLIRALRDVFPSLDRFNIREVVAYGKPYPEQMLTTSSFYFAAYFLLVVAACVLVFRKKDLT